MIKLYKSGDNMGIATDVVNENNFVYEISSLFEKLIVEKSYEGDWTFQFMYWLPQIASILMFFRGCDLSGYIERDESSSFPIKAGECYEENLAHKNW